MKFFSDAPNQQLTTQRSPNHPYLSTRKGLLQIVIILGLEMLTDLALPALLHAWELTSTISERLALEGFLMVFFCASFISLMLRTLTRTEAKLRVSQQSLLLMAANIPNGMIYQFLLRPDGSVSFPYISPSCKELFSIEAEKIQESANLLIEQIHQDDRSEFEQSVARSAQTLLPWQWEGRFVVNGEIRWMQCASRPQKQKNGSILWDGILMNVTKLKLTETALLTSEKKYRTIHDSVRDGIVKANTQDQFEECNQAFLDMLGYSREEITGRSCMDITPTRWQAKEQEIVSRQVMIRGYSDEYEKEFIKKDGAILPVAIKLWTTKDEHGQPESFWGLVRDISAYKKTEAELLRLAAVAQKAPSAVLMTDVTGRIQWVNDAFTQITGYTLNEALGQKPGQLLQGPDTDPDSIKLLRTALQRQEQIDCEIYNYRKDGEGVWLSVSIAPVRDEAGQIQGYIGLQTNITDRKQAQEELARYASDLEGAKIAQEENAAQLALLVEELEQAKERAEEAARAKSDFLATMSHEIRTPMNGVIGMAGLLLDTDLTSEQREYAETVRHSGEALLTIINDILDFSKIEAGKMSLEIIDFDLRTSMEETMELFTHQAQHKGLELACLIYADVPSALRGDPGRLRQILINLIGNAIKFTAQGEIVVEIKTATPNSFADHSSAQDRTRDEQASTTVFLNFTVRDTGIGIPAVHRNRLFQSFSQVDTSTTRKYGGTGLGLAICKKLTELMHGTIGVESKEGKGSTFWFTVQLERQPLPMLETTPRPDLAGLHALIIDDNTISRQIFHQQLSAWQVAVDEASDGPQALTMLRKAAAAHCPYDFVLLDFIMPAMDGLEFAKIVRKDPSLASIKLVLVTSAAHKGDGQLAREFGLDGYLTKPVRQAHLWGCLTTLLGRTVNDTTPRLITQHVLTEAQTRNRPLILIAEDNPVNQKLAVRLVEKLGYRADVAANGKEAIVALERIPYTLVLMDCQMPEMDGFEATREIRKREAQLLAAQSTRSEDSSLSSQLRRELPSFPGQRIPIIAMTANAMQGDRERCLETGMDDYISKPINPDALKVTLTHWVTTTTTKNLSEADQEAA